MTTAHPDGTVPTSSGPDEPPTPPTPPAPSTSDGAAAAAERLAVTADPTEQAGAENFPVALRVLPAAPRRHLLAIYGYARMVDDIGDEYTGDRIARLDAVEQELRGLYAGRPATEQVLRELAPTIEACGIPAEVLVRLIEANRVDQVVARYATFDQLADYCTLSANPVGELVLYVFGRHTATRVALSDRICTALQIVEHLQDVAEDHRAGRVYLPQEDLDRFGVTEADLAAPRANAALRNLVAYEAERAAAWLSAGEPLLSSLHGFARLAVAGYAAGGRAALAALARSGYDPLPGPPKASKAMVVGALLRTTFGRRA